MSGAPFASALYQGFWHDPRTGTLFTDSAEIRAMLLVWGALAEVQSEEGLIPDLAGPAIRRAAMEAAIDPGALSAQTARNGVVVPGLLEAFRAAIPGPEHRPFVHWGATSQDIMETGLVLRLRRALDLWEERLAAILETLGALARDHAETPMAGRTYGQLAAPTSFGAVAAEWGRPLLRHLDRLEEMRPRLLVVSLSGAAGTLSMMGAQGPRVRAGLAARLGLGDPEASWHAERDRIAELATWIAAVAGSLGKIGEDAGLLCQSGIEELSGGAAGASSTMPQKRNPVLPAQLAALARHAAGLSGLLQEGLVHRQQRDGAAWFGEWLALPPLCMALGRATQIAEELCAGLAPDITAMRAPLETPPGLIHAEALSFALAARLPRPEAQQEIKRLCAEAAAQGTPLADLLERDHPGGDWTALTRPETQLGDAPRQARAFADHAAQRAAARG
ncbi:class-II fumarase/aspartase family protein [Profundibacterium mesophilum]|uniref:3-carboxy-ciscis-muconate cycloisomerase n=1 Tax=Profundibacterium mesophilum KAUST100406-0324 TaxID=1037889 RepID=A0A921NVE8_9RHOB|nr:adenylosuccinate lyase family protein [Profundibacterium mesophilum]KAF0676225.1 3-carboxy-ciscis-muconate cycloisomerase [Profundibacterium mesophilum KAUST100406-0324]